jgi:hypothetical protein
MGTTQRIGNGVKNDPNWGSLTSSVTSAAKAVSDLEDEDSKEEAEDPEEVKKQEKRYATLIKRRDAHVKSIFERLIKVGGGSKKISSGKSTQIGRAGLKASGKLVSFFSSASTNGLKEALKEIGFGSLTGKTVRNVIDYLIGFCADSATGMDETASNKAINDVLRKIEEEADEDLGNLEDLFKEYTDSERLSELLCQFFGVYIFEYLSERLEERISQMKGEDVSKETFDCIKKDIEGRVIRLNKVKPVSKIDWSGDAGKKEIEKIFEAIIKIEEA